MMIEGSASTIIDDNKRKEMKEWKGGCPEKEMERR
jgi:hypothetical protein